MNRFPVLAVATALTWSAVGVAPPSSGAQAGSTVTFTSERDYVVSTTHRGRDLTGTGALPDGYTADGVRARPAADALGSRGVEVLVDLGTPVYSMSTRGHALFTHHRGRLRPVTLRGRPFTLTTYAEDSDQGGFRCRRGRLLVDWFHLGSRRGDRTTYRLAGRRLVQVSRTPLRRPVVSRPGSCS
ncbi:hypothetical protein KDN32_13260 [Nocardioides sp. J2M5]|uniref:hypothetical protein n=1 Tax=Nocardioides palaemonis TaxID=2829810 RepID=UPI001BA7A6E5|nr:hypothetical protein [Nocardioides palaemonis]MBS2938705.1 hypothetical protein [Nocardioides palaemonis]